MINKILKVFALGSLFGLLVWTPSMAGTLDKVKKRGYLICGTSTGFPGFSYKDDKGVTRGFDPDYCRAVTAAIFGDATKEKFKPTTTKNRFTALSSGEIDILPRDTTWTFNRDVDLKFSFIGITYYSGQGFMVKKSLGIKSAKELDGASICIQTGTSTELNLSEWFRKHNITYESIPVETANEALDLYKNGRCDAYTTDISALAALRSAFSNKDNNVILPDVISKEPLGPLVRQGDDAWADIGRWVFFALLSAEEHGITSKNVDQVRKTTKDPEVRRLLGLEGHFGKKMGIPDDWAYQVIKQVGNYGEIFERNLGKGSPIGLKRGLNALYTKGGLMYSPPFR